MLLRASYMSIVAAIASAVVGVLPIMVTSITAVDNLTPLRVPLELSDGEYVRRSVYVPLDYNYLVSIYFTSAQFNPIIPCETGATNIATLDCSQASGALKVSWSILSRGGYYQGGPGQYDYSGSQSGGNFIRVVGTFFGKKNTTYAFSFRTIAGVQNLRKFHPKLIIDVSPAYYESEMDAVCFDMVVLIIGEILALVLYLRYRRERRNAV